MQPTVLGRQHRILRQGDGVLGVNLNEMPRGRDRLIVSFETGEDSQLERQQAGAVRMLLLQSLDLIETRQTLISLDHPL